MDHFARDLNVHPDFFIPYNVRKPADEYYNLAAELLPNIWRLQQDYFWTYVKPRHIKNIVQGWKIHVSTSIENVETGSWRVNLSGLLTSGVNLSRPC